MTAKRTALLGALVIGAYQFIPNGLWWEGAVQFAVGLMAAVLIAYAGWKHPAGTRWIWMCFAAGIAAHAAGHLGFAASMSSSGNGGPDVWWLLLYPFFAIATVALIRRRRQGRNVSALIDSAMVAIGLGVLSWVAVIAPAVGDASLTPAHQALLISYPVGDMVLIALMTRLLNGAGGNASLRWITASIGFVLASDLCWVVVGDLLHVQFHDIQPVYRGVQQLFLVGYWCIAVAVRLPSAREAAQPAPAAARERRGLLLPTASAMVGPIVLWSEAADGVVADGQAIALGCALLFLLAAARIRLAVSQLTATAERMREMARHDDLTKLPNRRAWNDEFGRHLRHSLRSGETVSVGLIDLDRFKAYNDTFGHQAGDELLAEAAQRWREMLRAGDVLARYGGEEFVLLLPGADADEAVRVLTRLLGATPYGQTFSAGVATWNRAESPEAVLRRADEALYRAKDAGRNRVLPAARPTTEAVPAG